MEFHVYDTRIIRKLARYIELTAAYQRHKLDQERAALLERTLDGMSTDLTRSFEALPEEFLFHYHRAEELLQGELLGRQRAAAQRKYREELRAKERALAQELIAQG